MEPSLSPEVSSQPHSRRNSNAVMDQGLPPPMSITLERREPPPVLPPITQQSYMHELPPIATLPVTPAKQETSATLPPLRTQGEMEAQSNQATAAARRRTSSAASTKGRQNGYGSKIVACNFCRGECGILYSYLWLLTASLTARKTRCDGEHPSCGSCAGRNLPCNYVNDPANGNPKGRPKAAAGMTGPPSTSVSAGPSARNSPNSQPMPLSGALNGYSQHSHEHDLKRSLESEHAHPAKKMRVTDDLGHRGLAVSSVI